MKHLQYGLMGLALLGTTAFASPPPAGTIKLVRGQVLILDTGSKVVADPTGKRGRKTEVGSPFYVGETLQTKADGRVKIEFVEGGNEVVLGPDTALTIERSSTDAKKATGTSLSLARGEVRSTVKQKYSGNGKDVYEVKTPNAVAGVRGTIFTASFDAKNYRSDVATERGAVYVQSPGGSGVMVTPGMFTSAQGQNSVSSPRPISQNPELKGKIDSLSGSGGKSDKSDSSSDSKDSAANGSASGDSSKSSGTSKSSGSADSGSAKSSDKGSSNSSSNSNSSASSSSSSNSSSNSSGGVSPGASTDTSSANSNNTASSSKDSGSAPLGHEPVVAASSSDASAGRSPASVSTAGFATAAVGNVAKPAAVIGDDSSSATRASAATNAIATRAPTIGDVVTNVIQNTVGKAATVNDTANTTGNAKGHVTITIK